MIIGSCGGSGTLLGCLKRESLQERAEAGRHGAVATRVEEDIVAELNAAVMCRRKITDIRSRTSDGRNLKKLWPPTSPNRLAGLDPNTTTDLLQHVEPALSTHPTQSQAAMSMFGALNRFISRLDAEPQEREQGSKGAFGFQVLRNTNQELPIEPWFDFIIGINGRTIVCISPCLSRSPH